MFKTKTVLNYRNPSLSADGTWANNYWPVHTPIKREVLELNANYSRVIEGHRVKKCAFWKIFLPRLLALGKCNKLLYNYSNDECKIVVSTTAVPTTIAKLCRHITVRPNKSPRPQICRCLSSSRQPPPVRQGVLRRGHGRRRRPQVPPQQRRRVRRRQLRLRHRHRHRRHRRHPLGHLKNQNQNVIPT